MDTSVFVPSVHAASRPPAARACANCEAPQMGEYCYTCGQHFLEGRLTIRRLVWGFVVRKLGLEGGLLRTIVDLTVRPATMIRAYVNGRRQRYTNPVAYLLLTAGAYVFLSGAWTEAMEAGLRADAAGQGELTTDALVQVQMYMESHPAITTVFLCLFLVPALRLLFRKTTTTAESTVFALFVSGHLMLMQLVLNIGAILLSADVYRVMTGRITGFATIALLFLAGRFFGTGFSSYVRVALALTVSLLGFFVLMVSAVFLLNALVALDTAGATG